MRSIGMRWALVVTVALVVILAVPVVPVAQADGCQFVLSFATLESLIPQQVGQCLENEQHNPNNGDGLQHTTSGLLVWRKHPRAGTRNWTAFTDGYHAWVNGPTGLEYRLNTQRFAWEANPNGLPVIADAPVPSAPAANAGTVVADPALGIALTVPSTWRQEAPGQEAPGVLAFSSSANPPTRLYISSRGTTTDTDDAHAASVGMGALLRGINMEDAPRRQVSYDGAPAVLVQHVPGGPAGSTAIILAHQGAVYKILAPGTTIAPDQQQALNSLHFIPRVGPFPPAN